MKIALFTETYLPDVNGVVTSTVLLKEKLEEFGHEVWIVTNYPGLAKIKYEENGKIIRLPGLELKNLYGYKLSQPFHLLFIDELKKLNIDVIHAQNEFGVGTYASIVSKVLNIPLVRTYHTAYADYTSYFVPQNLKTLDTAAKQAIEVLSKIIGHDCIRLIAPSNKTKRMLQGYGIKTPISVIPTGLKIERFLPTNQNKEKIDEIRAEYNASKKDTLFVYIGRIASEKSIDVLISGFKIVKEKKMNAKLIIVGGGPALNDLKELVNQLQLNDYIIFAGKKPNDEIPLYYNMADCFVSASKSETQGLTYIEALSSGLPLICQKDDVLEDIIKNDVNGYYFDGPIEFGEKIINYIALNSEKKADLKNNALAKANEFDSNLFVENIVKLYQEVIDEYNSGYIIEKVSLKNENVVLNITNGEKAERIEVSTDTYLELGLRQNELLTTPILNRIKDEQNITLAYQKCLKKLSLRDYSEREIDDFLYVNFELNDFERTQIIDKLKERKYIDDDKYAFNKITSFKNSLYSNKMMTRKLKEAGISNDIINKYLKSDQDDELIKAKKIAEKYNLVINGKSLKMRKELLIRKLCDKGFSYDISKSAIEYLDFSINSALENETLRKECYKAMNKYSKKYTGRDLRNRVYSNLISKGFESDDVYAIISEMEENYD